VHLEHTALLVRALVAAGKPYHLQVRQVFTCADLCQRRTHVLEGARLSGDSLRQVARQVRQQAAQVLMFNESPPCDNISLSSQC